MLLKQGDRKKTFRRRKRKNKVERGNEIGEESKKEEVIRGRRKRRNRRCNELPRVQ